ncbi:MAG: isocitrate/isopropylmalate family dehydrogenase, partial [Bacteroidota bacterium]
MNTYKIAVVNGDGIGHEIVPAGMQVAMAAAEKHGFQLETEEFGYGAGHYQKTGQFMPDDALEKMQTFDAILFGAVGL